MTEPINAQDPELAGLIRKAETLMEALPYIQRFRGATVVIKYGGHAMIQPELKQSVMQDVVLMESVGVKPVIVHGGGPEITALTQRMGTNRSSSRPARHHAETLDVAEMVLAASWRARSSRTCRARRPRRRPLRQGRRPDPRAPAQGQGRPRHRLCRRARDHRPLHHPRPGPERIHPGRLADRRRSRRPDLQHQRRHGRGRDRHGAPRAKTDPADRRSRHPARPEESRFADPPGFGRRRRAAHRPGCHHRRDDPEGPRLRQGDRAGRRHDAHPRRPTAPRPAHRAFHRPGRRHDDLRMSGSGRHGLRTLARLNLAVWALIVFTTVMLDLWIKPNSGFQLMGFLMGCCFTLPRSSIACTNLMPAPVPISIALHPVLLKSKQDSDRGYRIFISPPSCMAMKISRGIDLGLF